MQPRTTLDRVTILLLIVATGLAGIAGWIRGSSVFGFESAFWDLGLLPTLLVLAIGVNRISDWAGPRRRFAIGFEIFGWAAVALYVICCWRPARWSPLSALLPFQTGFMLAPDMQKAWKDLNPGEMVVDAVVLISLPLLVALLGGVMFSARFTVRRIMVFVAVLALTLGALVILRRRVRQRDDLARYHQDQIVSLVYGTPDRDGVVTWTLENVDHEGRPVTARQAELDRWHWAMFQTYQRAASCPLRSVPPLPPPPD